MIPDLFVTACEARGMTGREILDGWQALEDEALDRLVAVAVSREDRAVTMTDSKAIAEEMFAPYGDDWVQKLTMQTLTYGLGKRLWDMHFFTEDGTEVPQETAFAEMREWASKPPDTDWEFGRNTIVKWVLFPQEDA